MTNALTPQQRPKFTGKTRRDRPDEVMNNAGGYVFQVGDWERLDRFLILGTDAGTYYATKEEVLLENAMIVSQLITRDGQRVVDRIVEISQAGRAPKNNAALFALAVAAARGNAETRKAAYDSLPLVARTGTHLLTWAAYTDALKGTGSGWKRAVQRWFTEKTPEQLAYQMIKYQQRGGWSMADLLRLAHVKPPSQVYDNIFKWAVDGWSWDKPDEYPDEAIKPVPNLIWAAELASGETDPDKLARLIQDYRLPWEALPTEALRQPLIWETLLDSNALPMEAMIRNLGRMSSIGLLVPGSQIAKDIVARLEDQERILKSRLHPFKVLLGMKTYASGKGLRGGLTWSPVTSVVDALDGAFYKAFGNVEPTGKKILIAIDVSGSMDWVTISGMPITPREAAAAMALVTLSVEDVDNTEVVAFASAAGSYYARSHPNLKEREVHPGLLSIPLSPRQRLDGVLSMMRGLPAGGTDCSLPALYAYKQSREYDGLIILTDNETWAGRVKPYVALEKYRKDRNPDLRQVVVGMTSTGFTIKDEKDNLSLDVVGLDSATPQLISDFIAGKF